MDKDFKERIIGFAWGLFACLLLSMLSGCRTKYVSVPEYHQVYVDRHDTLTKHDSVFQKEFVDRFVKGDTVYLTKTKVDYRYRNIYKTLYRDSIRSDSVRVPYPVEKSLTKWQQLKMNLGGIAIGGIIIAIISVTAWLLLKRKRLI